MDIVDRTETQNRGNIEIKMLPVDIFILLTKYLSGMDVVRLSCVCKYLYEVFSYDKLWTDLLKRERLQLDSTIMKTLINKTNDLISLKKALYISHKKVDNNWKNVKYKQYLKEVHKMSKDDDHMVVLIDNRSYSEWIQRPFARIASFAGMNAFGGVKPNINYLINIYSLCSPEFRTPIHKDVLLSDYVTIRKYMYDLDVEQIYICNDSLVIVFGGPGRLHKLVVLSISNNFREIWADDDKCSEAEEHLRDHHPLDTMCEAIHFYKERYFRINLSYRLMEMGNIFDDMDKNRKIIWPTRFTAYTPSSIGLDGLDMAFDGTYLALTGHHHDRDIPILIGWNVKKYDSKKYYPKDQICNMPHRWNFFKVEIQDGKVYGMLDKRFLLVWDADNTKLLNTICLSDTYPGRLELSLNAFIQVSRHRSDCDEISCFVVTVDRDEQSLKILDRHGIFSQEIGWSVLNCYDPSRPCLILDVLANKNFIVIPFVDEMTRLVYFIVIPLPLGKLM